MAGFVFSFGGLLAVAGAQSVFDVGTGTVEKVNNGGTVFISQGKLSETRGVVCYTDYAYDSFGICNTLDLSGENLTVGGDFVFNANATLHVSVAALSETHAVVCYSDKGNTERVTCTAFQVDGVAFTKGEPLEVDGVAQLTSFISVASLDSTSALVCYSCAGCPSEGEGKCAVLSLDGTTLSKGADISFTGGAAATHISVQGFSASSAVACYSNEGDGSCTLLDASSGLTAASTVAFHQTATNFFDSISVAKVAEGSGVVCYADATNDGNFAACNALEVGAALAVGDAEVVNSRNSSSVSVAPLTSTGGIVCFVDLNSEEDPNQEDAAGPATCKVLSVDGVALKANPANVVNANPTEYLNLVGLSADAAMMCYSNQGAGEGFCTALSIAETTTTSTQTDTQTSSTTATLTSSSETSSTTSPHTTTAATTSSTPHTTTETGTTQSSATTTPHTTTETLTSTTETSVTTATEGPEPIESSACARVAVPAACGLLAAAMAAVAC
jgi:hypothetical protein